MDTNDPTQKIPIIENGIPQASRKETVAAMNALIHSQYPRNDVIGEGPLLLSEITGDNLVLGIDEAGRGSVVGPMIYGMAYWSANESDNVPQDLNDSKQLTEKHRDKLFGKIMAHEKIGFGVRVLHASEISRNMLRPEPYNLNQISHDAAIAMIRAVKERTTIQTCYIDTVGNPTSYQRRLEREFPGVEFVVESKADDKYAPCSAASIVAKVVRDSIIKDIEIKESGDMDAKFGSGYPSDPICKAWMAKAMISPIFGFPNIVRFSWGPAKQQLEKEAIKITFQADVEEEEDESLRVGRKRQQRQMQSFLSGSKKRHSYFVRKRIVASS